MFYLPQIKRAWDEANRVGEILWRADTLMTKAVAHRGLQMEVVYNSVRDSYDKSVKAIDRPSAPDDPFAHNPLLAESEVFRLYGNPYSCMRYQFILVPKLTRTSLSVEFISELVAMARVMPSLRVLYNGRGAGKTIPQEFGLVSLHDYPGLSVPPGRTLACRPSVSIVTAAGVYRLVFPLDHELLWAMCRIGHPFDFILHDGRATFIPRKPIESPVDPSHRFGGLEMIGTFIVKSREQFHSADVGALWEGVVSISLDDLERQSLELRLAQIAGGES